MTTTTHLDIGVHDPSMIWDGSRYYLFATGGTLGVRSSADIINWRTAGNVLSAVPSWVTSALGSNPGSLWAPDISYFNGQFHVYYAGSTFGSNSSVIGLATTASLGSPTWVDQGLVVQSKTTDNFNAIDPNVSFDQDCAPWLAFGSFWSGIKMRKLDAATGKLATDDTTLYALASRPNNGGAIEASSIVSHNGYYYLFVSFDACCKGVNSTYNTNVGRATKITGPYANKAGTAMMQGGADLLLATSGRYIGPGGGTAWQDGNTYLYAYHYYDGQDNGNSKLQVRPINFDANDWVTLGAPLFP
jgi:arabinan endo-1,5-alpha-L-arabinosidase